MGGRCRRSVHNADRGRGDSGALSGCVHSPRLAARVLAALLLVASCRSQPTRESPGNDLQPFMLPDVSRLAESVQRQLHQRHEQLTAKLASKAAQPPEVASAYGDLGGLL